MHSQNSWKEESARAEKPPRPCVERLHGDGPVCDIHQENFGNLGVSQMEVTKDGHVRRTIMHGRTAKDGDIYNSVLDELQNGTHIV